MSARFRITAFLGAFLIRLIGCSWRFRIIDEEYMTETRKTASALIFTFWHGRMLPLSYRYRNRAIHVLASQHRDGEFIGQTIRFLGFGHVRGSSTRGGAKAIRELVGKLEEGFDLGITVDGPKGPRFEVKPGPIEISKLSGAPIVPVTTGSKSHWTFSSWDAFELPKPFTEIHVRLGKPVFVPPDADGDMMEVKRKELEEILRQITAINDQTVANA